MFSIPRGNKMFQFPRLSSLPYVFRQGLHSINHAGFPHSGISGSTPVSGSPKLIAACYALHRPLAPRNPPSALLRLTNILSDYKRYSIVKDRLPIKGKFKKKFVSLQTLSGYEGLENGGERARTDDLLRARQALSQLSYTPVSR